jgi:hypothetical protein
MLRRQLQADAITPRQLQRRAGAPGVIYRTDGVYDVLPVKRHAQATQLGHSDCYYYYFSPRPLATTRANGILTLEGCSLL